jgi:hypothetical protein
LALALLTLPFLPVQGIASPDVASLQELAQRFAARLAAERTAQFDAMRASDDPALARLNDDPATELIRIDAATGMPRYYSTENVDAAATISTDRVHPGGGAGFSLTGSGTNLGQLAVWDGGAVRVSHQEFAGRATQMDGASSLTSHGTHVSGTMIGAGTDPDAKGMSYQAELGCYDWNSDTSEMATAAAAGLLISNHSYGYTTGWRYSSGTWYWYGDTSVSTTEDYGFGYYNEDAADIDQVAFDAPEYLVVMSGGNDRGDGPSPGTSHLVWDSGWVSSNDVRDLDGGADGYDSVNWTKVAKNILAVGAVEDLPGGYTTAAGVDITSFSGWGPTDDGRIKPDLSANGRGLYSSTAGSNSAYSTYSGTSMAAPNASGSASLVNEHWRDTHPDTMRSATLKAILLHTADEAGDSDGPDYEYGWGLMNTESAVRMVEDDAFAPAGTRHVVESSLDDAGTDEYVLVQAAPGPVKVTLCWTDPAGTPPAASLNPTDPMLVNDLDLRLSLDATTHEPWVLNPASPASAATPGDNVRDNVEQVWVASLPAGTWTVQVSHKGTLDGGVQAYSLVVSTPIAEDNPAVSAPVLAESGPSSPIAYPNPFVAGTTVAFRTPAASTVSVSVHDVAGRRVRTLASAERMDAGTHRLSWDGRSEAGADLPSGVYFARVTADGRTTSSKIVRVNTR